MPFLEKNRFVLGCLLLTACSAGISIYSNRAVHLLYLPSVFIPLLFWWAFFSSLLPGRIPLVTQIGESARGPLSKEMRAYTRSVTVLWTIVLAIITLGAIGSPFWKLDNPWLKSSLLFNYMVIPIVFIGEFYLRKWKFKDHNHPGLIDYLKIVTSTNIIKGPIKKDRIAL